MTTNLATTQKGIMVRVWPLALTLGAVLLPFLIHNQWFTGPLVNAALIVVLFCLGWRAAALVAFLPSLAALGGGLLPIIAAPLIPIIIAGNLILITVIYQITKIKFSLKTYWFALTLAALAKFFVMFLAAKGVTALLGWSPLNILINTMFSWPQLITALVGGVLAFGAWRSRKMI